LGKQTGLCEPDRLVFNIKINKTNTYTQARMQEYFELRLSKNDHIKKERKEKTYINAKARNIKDIKPVLYT